MALFNSIRLGASAASAYEVERSLRFNDDDSAYLTRTPSSAGNRKKWTFSAWIKRSNLGGSAGEQRIFGGNANASHIFISTDDKFRWDLSNEQSGSASATLSTNPVFRDPSAWYHLVCALDTDNSTANNRMKMYVNGTEVTSFVSRTNPSSGYATNAINNNTLHTLGYRTSGQGSAGMEFDGYMAEVNFVDGQQYDPSYFGETDALTGQWNPKKYVGSYGTNGFYLNFLDNSGTTATTLGKDSSGNGNNFTPNNFSVAAGAGNDSVFDSPTNNFCTFNPLKVNASYPLTFTNGNLQHNGVSGGHHLRSSSTMQVNSGKWYVEFKFVSGYETTNGTVSFGLTTDAKNNRGYELHVDAFWYQNTDNFVAIGYQNNGVVQVFLEAVSQSTLSGLPTFVNGDVMGLAVDLDNDKLFVSKNGTFFSNGTGTQDPANGTNPVYSGGFLTSRKSDGFYFSVDGYSAQVVEADFGQQGYAYTPPTGFKKVNSANLPDPTIKLPNQHFNTLLYTGNGGTQSITGLNFAPDWTWLKERTDASTYHVLFDAVRGVTKAIYTNDTLAENTGTAFTSFDSDGFTLSLDTNQARSNDSGDSYVAWNWNGGGSTVTNNDGTISAQVRANTSAGFSIVSYTVPSGSGYSVGHGLGVVPQVIFVKNRDTSSNWDVYNVHIGNTKRLKLNTSAAEETQPAFNNQTPTSTVFYGLGGGSWHGVGSKMINYVFSEVAGYSKFGSYTGNGSSDGTFVFTGFRPAWIMTKRTDSTSNWIIHDNKRDSYNVIYGNLIPNSSNAESTGSVRMDFVSNGFKHRNSDGGAANNISGATYIYLAFAESPFKNSRAR